MSDPKRKLPLYSITAWRGTTYISLAQNWLTKILDNYEVRATERQVYMWCLPERDKRLFSSPYMASPTLDPSSLVYKDTGDCFTLGKAAGERS